jgi:hypothetical protein
MQLKWFSRNTKAPTLFIWLSLMQSAILNNRYAVRAEEKVPECAGLKIAILDLNDLSVLGDFSKCNLEVPALSCTNTGLDMPVYA